MEKDEQSSPTSPSPVGQTEQSIREVEASIREMVGILDQMDKILDEMKGGK